MKQVTLNLYSYKELDDDAKQVAIGQYPDWLAQMDWEIEMDDCKCQFIEKMKEKGFEEMDICLSERHGSDVSFYMDKDKLEKVAGCKLFAGIYDVFVNYKNGCLENYNHYLPADDEAEADKAYCAIDDLCEKILKEYQHDLRMYEQNFYTDDFRSESMMANELLFTESGKLFDSTLLN